MKVILCFTAVAVLALCAKAAPGRYQAPDPSAAASARPTTSTSPPVTSTDEGYGLPSAVAVSTPTTHGYYSITDDQGSSVAVPTTPPHYAPSTTTYDQGTVVTIPSVSSTGVPATEVLDIPAGVMPTTAAFDGPATGVFEGSFPAVASVDAPANPYDFPIAAATPSYGDSAGTAGSAPTSAFEQPSPTVAGVANAKPTNAYGPEQTGAYLGQASDAARTQVQGWGASLAALAVLGAGMVV